MSRRVPVGFCPECSGNLYARPTGFHACGNCGKLVIPEKVEPPKEEVLPPPPVVPTGPLATLEADSEFEFRMPDYTDVMLGWRAWGIRVDLPPTEPPFLHSVTFTSQIWHPRQVVEAECERTRRSKPHDVPGEHCSCGLYSAKTRAHLMSMSYHRYDAERRGMWHIMGEVSLWGKIVEGTQGWRAQFGYPRKLYVPFEAWKLVEPLKDLYGVPVELNNILRRQ